MILPSGVIQIWQVFASIGYTTKHYQVVPDRQMIPGVTLRHEHNTWRRGRTFSAETQALPTISWEQGGCLAPEIEGSDICPDERIVGTKRKPRIGSVHNPFLPPACVGNQTRTDTAGIGFHQAETFPICSLITIRIQSSRFARTGLSTWGQRLACWGIAVFEQGIKGLGGSRPVKAQPFNQQALFWASYSPW